LSDVGGCSLGRPLMHCECCDERARGAIPRLPEPCNMYYRQTASSGPA
jgi:hypothetical protein